MTNANSHMTISHCRYSCGCPCKRLRKRTPINSHVASQASMASKFKVASELNVIIIVSRFRVLALKDVT